MKIYLVSRTEEKLKAAAEEIAAKYKVETGYFVADLVAAGRDSAAAAWFGLAQNLAAMDVGVLVNNAGMSYDHPEFFDAVAAGTLDDIVAINVTSLSKARRGWGCCVVVRAAVHKAESPRLLQMVHTVLPGMKQRRRGCIVNISSGVSSYLPACPLLAAYAASKAFVDNLSMSLAAEYRGFGIDVQARALCCHLVPAPTCSALSCVRAHAEVQRSI